jgi:hypothetical protein
MNDIIFGEEDAKYIKKKPHKKVKKSSHKHIYDSYIMIHQTRFNKDRLSPMDYAVLNYCSKCGKIHNMKLFLDEDIIKKFIKRKKVIDVNSITDYFNMKYFPIVRSNDN